MIDKNNLSEQGLKLELKKYEDTTVNRYIELKFYLLEVLKSYIKPIECQISIVDEFVGELKRQNCTNYFLKLVNELNTDSVKEIDNKDLFKIFVTNKEGEIEEKIKMYLKLERSVNFIKAIIPQLSSDLEVFTKKYITHTTDWKNNIKSMQSYSESIVSESLRNNKPSNHDLFLDQLKNIIRIVVSKIEHQKDENFRDPYSLINSYVKPIEELCNKFASDIRASLILQ